MGMLMITILIALLFIAAWQDCRGYRIRNSLVMLGALLGIFLNSIIPTGLNFYDSLAGLGVGLLLLLPLYLLRMMGAGDVKLMAMVGAFLGPHATMTALLYVLIAGGLLSIAVTCYRGMLKKMLLGIQLSFNEFFVNLSAPKSERSISLTSTYGFSNRLNDSSAKIPYGVAIAVGTMIYLITDAINYSLF